MSLKGILYVFFFFFMMHFMCLVFIRKPGRVTVGESGLYCVPCLSNAVISLCLLILLRHSSPHSVSGFNNLI